MSNTYSTPVATLWRCYFAMAAGRFDITRRPNPHIAFGVGEHYCLGANLAWAEAESTFTLLAHEMLATMRLDGPVLWKEHHIVRGLEALPVAW